MLLIPAFQARYGNLKSSEITPAIISEIGTALGKTLSPATTEAAAALIRGGGEQEIVKWIASEENFAKLEQTLKGMERDEVLMACPHCSQLIEIKLSEIVSH